MKLALIADEASHNLGLQLSAALHQMGCEHSYLDLSALSIKPCTACASCSGKTYGRCIQMDDMEGVYRAIARADHWVLLSTLRFGGLSSMAKRVLDRSGVLADVHYYYQDGELVKGRKNNTRAYSAVGIKQACNEKEKDAFINLHKENTRIMNCPGRAYVMDPLPGEGAVKRLAEDLCHG